MWNSVLSRTKISLFSIAVLLFGYLGANAQTNPVITVNGSTTICPGDSVQLISSQGDTYQWLNMGFPIFGATSQTYVAKQNGQFSVIVTTNLIPATSATAVITVSPLPTVVISSGSTAICPGTQVSLSLTGNNSPGNAASMNAFMNTSAHVLIPHQAQLNSTPLTMEIWIRPLQNNVTAGIASKLPIATSLETGYGFKQVNNRFRFVIGREGTEVAAESNTFNTGTWYHLTGTYDGSTVKIYVNGIQQGSNTISATINSTADLVVGNLNSMSAPFKGMVDELRIWNQIKPDADIQCNYKMSVPTNATGLKGYWRMNEVSSGATPDITSYGDNGALVNGTTLTTSGALINSIFVWDAAPGITNVYSACQSVIPAATTIYKATATNYAGCTATDTQKVTVLPLGQVYNVTGSGNYCMGTAGRPVGLDGSEPGVLYQLKKGSANIGGLVSGTGDPLTLALVTDAGTYTVIATNGNCTNSMAGSAVITVSPSPEISSAIVTNNICNGGSAGAVDITVSSGTPSFTYAWSNNTTAEDLSNVAAGNYNVTVTDAVGCTATGAYNITEPTPVLISSSTTNVQCNGFNTGSIMLTMGGTAPYTFAWSNSATTQNLSNIPAGNYSVNITDNAGCTATSSFAITQPTAIVLSANTTNVACHGSSTGAIDLGVSGGTGSYTYSWSNNATTQDLSNIPAGTYTVTVTDANSCSKTASYTITEPAQLTANTVATNISCYNAANGSINLTVAGGTAPYSYSWSNNAATEDIASLSPGTYTVTVTDAHGCVATASATINEPALLAVSGVVIDVACFGNSTGAVDITVTGGTAPYVYSWSNNATTQDITNLAAGTYSVNITDAHGCTVTGTFNIATPPMLVVTQNITDPSCNSGNNGAIDITLSGPAGPFSYSWSNNATTEDISGLTAGSYSVTISYGSCTTTKTFTLQQPAALVASATATATSCGNNNDGSVTLTVSGGTAPYSYSWSNNATTQNLSNVPAGTYTVTVTDAHGCTTTASATVTQPAPLVFNSSVTNVACNGGNTGAINLTITSGTAPFSFAWSNNATTEDLSNIGAGSYSVTVTDSKNCTATGGFTVTEPSALSVMATATNILCYGSNTGAISISVAGGTAPYSFNWGGGITTQNRTDLAAGTYSVTVTDAHGCTSVKSVTLTQPAAPLTITKVAANVLCNGGNNGSIDITVTGGTGSYAYAWSNNATTQDLGGLAAGTYTVTVTDANGCTASNTTTITQPAAILISANTTNVTCYNANNGSIDITVSGGTLPYSYLWSNNATTQDLNNIGEGIYHVAVTDNHGCVASDSMVIDAPDELVVSATGTNILCNGANNGTLTVSASGGTAPYSYLWSNNATAQNLSGLGAGTYVVTVTDSKGCTHPDTVVLVQPSALSVSGIVTNVTVLNGSNGAINITATGGTQPYSYHWSNNATTEDLTGIQAGNYSVTVTDDNGCTVTGNYTVTQPTGALTISGTVTNPSCGNNNGSILLNVTGGTPPYTYYWVGGVTTQNRTGLGAGTYTVYVIDSKGMIQTKSFTLTSAPAVNAAIAVSPVITVTNGAPYTIYLGYGPQSVTLTANATGGTAPYTYNWSGNGVNGATTQSVIVSPTTTQTYTLTVTDSKGCSKLVTRTINVIDVRSGNKIKVCHNGNTLTIASAAVKAHLAHGDNLGSCENGGCNKPGPQNNEEEQGDEAHEEGQPAVTQTTSTNIFTDMRGKAISVYPNPSSGAFTLQLPAGETSAQIMITDINGKLVERRVVDGINTVGFDLSHVAQGVYNIHVSIGAQIYNSKVIIK